MLRGISSLSVSFAYISLSFFCLSFVHPPAAFIAFHSIPSRRSWVLGLVHIGSLAGGVHSLSFLVFGRVGSLVLVIPLSCPFLSLHSFLVFSWLFHFSLSVCFHVDSWVGSGLESLSPFYSFHFTLTSQLLFGLGVLCGLVSHFRLSTLPFHSHVSALVWFGFYFLFWFRCYSGLFPAFACISFIALRLFALTLHIFTLHLSFGPYDCLLTSRLRSIALRLFALISLRSTHLSLSSLLLHTSSGFHFFGLFVVLWPGFLVTIDVLRSFYYISGSGLISCVVLVPFQRYSAFFFRLFHFIGSFFWSVALRSPK